MVIWKGRGRIYSIEEIRERELGSIRKKKKMMKRNLGIKERERKRTNIL